MEYKPNDRIKLECGHTITVQNEQDALFINLTQEGICPKCRVEHSIAREEEPA